MKAKVFAIALSAVPWTVSSGFAAVVDRFHCSTDMVVWQLGQRIETEQQNDYSVLRELEDYGSPEPGGEWPIPENIQFYSVRVSDRLEQTFEKWLFYSIAEVNFGFEYQIAEMFDPATHSVIDARGSKGCGPSASIEFWTPNQRGSKTAACSTVIENPFEPGSGWDPLLVVNGKTQVWPLFKNKLKLHAKGRYGHFAATCEYLESIE